MLAGTSFKFNGGATQALTARCTFRSLPAILRGREPHRARRQDRDRTAILHLLPPLSAAAFAETVRSHWTVENNLHWSLDVAFSEDQSRLRTGHGARNMAVVRHFAPNLVRQVADQRSLKRRRKCASWHPKYLLEILGPLRC